MLDVKNGCRPLGYINILWCQFQQVKFQFQRRGNHSVPFIAWPACKGTNVGIYFYNQQQPKPKALGVNVLA